MLKYRKKWRKGCDNTPFIDLLRFSSFLCLAFLVGCAARPPQPAAPRVILENPAKSTTVASGEHFNEAFTDYQNGKYSKARKEFQKELKENPQHYPSYLGIGYTYLAEKQLGEAEKFIRKALDLQPDYPQAKFALANLLEQQQDYDSALRELDQVAQLNPDYPGIQESRNVMKLKATERHLNEAQTLRDSNPELALQHLKAAQQLAPEVSSVPVDIAAILIKQGNCLEAVPYLEKATQLAPDNADVKQQMAQCLIETKDYARAVSIYEDLAAQHPEDPQIQTNLNQVRKLLFIQSLPEEYQQIPQSPQITRGQFAALVMTNLEFLQNLSSTGSQILVDTINHWAKNFILKTVELGIMDSYPNRTFQPDQPLTRLELAKAASRILEIIEGSGKQIASGAAASVIPDVPVNSVYYRMIAKAISSGLVTLDTDGNFHVNRTVSGAGALSLINRIKQISE